jgi:hypothetical protein
MKKFLKTSEFNFFLYLSVGLFSLMGILTALHLGNLISSSKARIRPIEKIEITPSLPKVQGIRSPTIIEGSLSYPSEGIPTDLTVCAQNLETSKLYCTQNHLTNKKYLYGFGYQLIVAPGTYHVYSYLPTSAPSSYQNYKAYYTQAVICGLTVECSDHTPIEVTLTSGQRLQGIDPADWYNF